MNADNMYIVIGVRGRRRVQFKRPTETDAKRTAGRLIKLGWMISIRDPQTLKWSRAGGKNG